MNIPRDLKLRHLEAFLAIAETGTISGAARAQHVSQPAMSKTLSDLEGQLGCQLFERTGRRAILTTGGEVFRRHAKASLQSLEAGCRVLSAPSHTDLVKAGVLPTVAGGFFPSVALEFYDQRPDARIGVLTGPNHYLIDMLRSGKIDLMIGRMPNSKDMPGLSFEHLYDEPIELVARADHPALGRKPAQMLTEYPLILPNPGAIIRQSVDQYLSAMGLSDLRPALETVALPVALTLLERSKMLWFISKGVVARELKNGSLVAMDLKVDYLSGAVGLTRKTGAGQNSLATLLAELLHQRAALNTAR
ncbi:MAG: LysR substrate-binding domain-containing protein [Rhodobacterales bacterium]|jgi:LysR family pca operon transcriptional activator